MAVLSVRRLVGADAVLAVHGPALPQPDQLCGPFAAWAALHALGEVAPTVSDLAIACHTAVWPDDVAEWRPAGAPLDRSGWDRLPRAATIDASGTDAASVADGIAALCPRVSVIPAGGPGDVAQLMTTLIALGRPVGVVANLRTGPIAPPGATWDVGHFVVLWGMSGEEVAVADSYAELGAPGLPPGCRVVPATRLGEAIAGRGLLVLVADVDAADVRAAVAAAGLADRLWST